MSGELDIARMEGDMMAAREAAVAVAGVPMLGLRAVQPGTGGRAWLIALEGPAFLCLDDALDPEPTRARVLDVAQAGLAAELADEAVDATALRAFRAPAAAMDAWGADLPAAVAALGRAAEEADALAAWREDPGASLPRWSRSTRRQPSRSAPMRPTRRSPASPSPSWRHRSPLTPP